MTKKTNNTPYIEEVSQKTFESEPLTPKEIIELKLNLYSDDIDGGLQNIQLIDEEIEEIRLKEEKSLEFMEIKDEVTEIPHLTDNIKLKLPPDSLMIIIEVLKRFSLDMKNIQYLEKESKSGDDIYEQQTEIRLLVLELNRQLNNYISNRPYSPFFESWVKRIGRSNVRKV